MILGFKREFPWGEPTYFKEKILSGAGYGPIAGSPKIHSIRNGFRWEKGMSIQMAYGIRTKKYEQFNKGIDGLQICTGFQTLEIYWPKRHKGEGFFPSGVKIDGLFQTADDLNQLALNDGFESLNLFFKWFSDDFYGQIIHWTDFRYNKDKYEGTDYHPDRIDHCIV